MRIEPPSAKELNKIDPPWKIKHIEYNNDNPYWKHKRIDPPFGNN
jgi:hypothetical protein